MKTLSMLLPTYNRADFVDRFLKSVVVAGKSALSQIQIVVVDDGSTDDTDKVLQGYANTVELKYLRLKENGGRAHAVIAGVGHLNGEFTMIVDSDDYFLDEALNSILGDLDRMPRESNSRPIAGCCYRLLDSSGKLLGKPYHSDRFISNFSAVAYGMGHGYDKKEVVLTSVLKSRMYPFVEGERRFPTSYVWDAISKDHDAIFLSRPIMTKSYNSDGMTKNLAVIRKDSNVSSYLAYRQKYELSRVIPMTSKNRLKFFLLMLNYGYMSDCGGDMMRIIPWYQKPFAKLAHVYLRAVKRVRKKA